MNDDAGATFLLAEARRTDPARALAATLAPPARRTAILALLVLDRELARIPALAKEPMTGLIRFQWWRDAIAGRHAHPALDPLRPLLATGDLDAHELVALIDAREADLAGAPPSDLAALESWAAARAGRTHALLARAGGCSDERWLSAARDVGTALGMTGRALADREASGTPSAAATAQRARQLVGRARRAGRAPATALAALLPAMLAMREAAALTAGRPPPATSPFLPLCMAWAALTGRF